MCNMFKITNREEGTRQSYRMTSLTGLWNPLQARIHDLTNLSKDSLAGRSPTLGPSSAEPVGAVEESLRLRQLHFDEQLPDGPQAAWIRDVRPLDVMQGEWNAVERHVNACFQANV